MNNTTTDNQKVSVQGCNSGKGYQSIYQKPNVWTAPWCNCGPWINPPHPKPNPCPPYYQCPPNWNPTPPPFPPCPPPFQPYPPQPFPPYTPPPCPPPPCPPTPPKPKPTKPNFPDNCPQDMLWLLLGYWMGSNCQNNT